MSETQKTENGIIHAYAFDGKGGAKALKGAAVSEAIKDKALAWVHLDASDPQTRKWLNSELDYLDHIIIDALLASETRPRVVEFQEGVLLILRGVNLNENAEPEDMISVRLWIDQHRIVSLRLRQLKAVKDVAERLENGTGPKNAGEFMAMLSARLFERMEPVLQTLDEQLDDTEEAIIDDPDIKQHKIISTLRKRAIVLRRYIAPQRDAIAALRVSGLRWLDQTNRRNLQESTDRLTRYIEDLDTIRERAQIVKDELTTALSDRMNKNLYMLSVIAAIFLPLGFLTGLLGINVAGIPGADYGQAFLFFCLILAGVVIAQIALFKKLKWF